MMTKKQAFVFNYLLMNTTMCIFMSLAGLLVNVGYITLPMYGAALVQALVINNLCTLIFRIPTLGFKLSMLLSGGDPESRAFQLWGSVINPTLNTLFMTTFMTLVNVGFRPEYFAAWLHGFPALELVSLAVSFFAAPLWKKVVKKVK